MSLVKAKLLRVAWANFHPHSVYTGSRTINTQLRGAARRMQGKLGATTLAMIFGQSRLIMDAALRSISEAELTSSG